ncbi:hypothetical protein NUSPORA_02502 [Nucleospora cyclopteri]
MSPKEKPKDFVKLDEEISLILTKNKIHFQPTCKERFFYLPRTEMVKKLCAVKQRGVQLKQPDSMIGMMFIRV